MTLSLVDFRKTLKSQKELDYFDIHVNRYAYLLTQIAKLGLKPSAKILDIGCYPPHLFTLLKSQSFSLFGLSSPHEPVNLPQIKTCNLETKPLPYSKNTFDLIIFTEVLEHLSVHPSQILCQLKTILKKDGHLLLTTPNVLRSQNLFSLIFGKNIYFPLFQLNQNPNHRHQREYSSKELIKLFKTLNFKIIKSDFFISYSPFRAKNKKDSLFLKVIKTINYIFMLIFPVRRDNLFFLLKA